MTQETEGILDRRRLRRKLGLWRGLAIVAAMLALGALALVGGGAKQLVKQDQIARVSVEGMITEDRKQIEVEAVEDRQKAIEEKENAMLAKAKESAKVRAQELAASSAQAFADRFHQDAIGLVSEVFTRIAALPQAQQISLLSSLFGDEARALAPLLGNLGAANLHMRPVSLP